MNWFLASWQFYALLSALFAAFVAIFGKIGLGTLDSTLATTIRAVIMATFLFFVSLFLQKANLLWTVEKKDLLYIALSGIAGSLSWLCYFYALQVAPANFVPGVAALDRLSIVFVVILTALFLGQKFSFTAFIGALFMTIGAIIITLK